MHPSASLDETMVKPWWNDPGERRLFFISPIPFKQRFPGTESGIKVAAERYSTSHLDSFNGASMEILMHSSHSPKFSYVLKNFFGDGQTSWWLMMSKAGSKRFQTHKTSLTKPTLWNDSAKCHASAFCAIHTPYSEKKTLLWHGSMAALGTSLRALELNGLGENQRGLLCFQWPAPQSSPLGHWVMRWCQLASLSYAIIGGV